MIQPKFGYVYLPFNGCLSNSAYGEVNWSRAGELKDQRQVVFQRVTKMKSILRQAAANDQQGHSTFKEGAGKPFDLVELSFTPEGEPTAKEVTEKCAVFNAYADSGITDEQIVANLKRYGFSNVNQVDGFLPDKTD